MLILRRHFCCSLLLALEFIFLFLVFFLLLVLEGGELFADFLVFVSERGTCELDLGNSLFDVLLIL